MPLKLIAAALKVLIMKQAKRPGKRLTRRLELGEHIVADPEICHGKPTFKGTRIMVWQILDELAHGMTPEEIVKAWGGRVSRVGIAECVQLARRSFLDSQGRLRRVDDLRRAA